MIGDIMARIIGLTSPGGGLAQVYRYFTTLAAASSKYYEIDPVELEIGDKVQITFQAPTVAPASFVHLLSSSNLTDRKFLVFNPSGNFQATGFEGTMLLDGVTVSTGLVVPIDGMLHTIELTCSILGDPLTHLGANGVNDDLFFNSILADFKVLRGATVIADYPIDETWSAGSTTLINRVGTNGTAINVVQADAELFKLNTSTSPDQWENLDLTRIIPIAGTP